MNIGIPTAILTSTFVKLNILCAKLTSIPMFFLNMFMLGFLPIGKGILLAVLTSTRVAVGVLGKTSINSGGPMIFPNILILGFPLYEPRTPRVNADIYACEPSIT